MNDNRNAILAYADMSYEKRSGVFDKQYAFMIDAVRDVSPSELFVEAVYPVIQPKVGELWGSNVRCTKAVILEAYDNTVIALEYDGLKLRYIDMALDDFLKLNYRMGDSKHIKGLFNELDYYCQLDDKMEF